MSAAANPFVDKVRSLLAAVADGRPVVMINLLRFRDQADYGPDSDATPCTGREAYQRYSQATMQFITAIGAQVIWYGSAKGVLVGPRTERWDTAFLVRYPSKQAFLEMIGNPDYQAVTKHRTAALEDSRLIATTPAEPTLDQT
jgi:uncharacterized protein (DUF1330 family)